MNMEELRSRKDRGPYDTALENNFDMYDRMPYIRDIEICRNEHIGMISGNIIKYYRCRITQTFKILVNNNMPCG